MTLSSIEEGDDDLAFEGSDPEVEDQYGDDDVEDDDVEDVVVKHDADGNRITPVCLILLCCKGACGVADTV